MILAILCLLLITLLFTKRIKVNNINKYIVYLYSIYSFGVLAFSTFNLYKLNDVSNKVYIMWIVNIVLVIGTILIFSKKESGQIEEIQQTGWINEIAKSKLLFFTGLILLSLLVFYKVKYEKTLQNLPLSEIRMVRYGAMFSSGVETIFFDYILIGILTIFLIIGAMLIVNKKIINRITIVTLLCLALYSSIGYGRMIIFEFVVFIVFSYLIFNCGNKIKINLKSILVFISFVIILVLTGAVIVVIRLKGIDQLSFENIFKYGIQEQIDQLYRYFEGGFRTFDYFLQNGFEGINKPTITRLTFGGIEDLFGLVVNNIGFNFTTINSIIAPITQKSISVGNGIYMNAFYTCLMNYYCDLGYVGIVIYPVLHGLLIAYGINNYIKKKDIISYVLMMYILYNMIASIYRWNYQGGATMFLTLSIIIFDIGYHKIYKRSKYHENTLDS